jgi:hypothetical protein
MYMANSRSESPTFSPRAIVVGAHLKEGEPWRSGRAMTNLGYRVL